MDSLYKSLRFFDGDSGLDNLQVKFFLRKAFLSGELKKKDILIDISLKLSDPDFNWRDYLNGTNFINNIQDVSQDQLKEYVLELVCDYILSIEL
jgi:hypothetical protein